MEDCKKTIQAAIECHKKGDFKNAEKFYLEFLDKNPAEAKAHHLLGGMNMQAGNYQKALKSLETAYKLEKSLPIESDLALCYFELKNYKNAYQHFKKIAPKANSRVIYEKITKCTENLNLPLEKLKYNLKLLKFDKNSIALLREITALAQDLGKFKIAEKYLNKLIKICPGDFIAWNNLGLIYEFTSRFDKAECAYRKAFELKPNIDAAYNLSVLLKRMRRYNEAIEVINLAEQLEPENRKFEYTKSTLYLAQKDFKAGYKMYSDFLRTKQAENIKIWWNGEENKTATLAICATEGFGDIIMFSRYLNLINTANFKKVILILPKTLYSLYKYNFPNFNIVEMGSTVEYNYATTLIELPLLFNKDFEHIPENSGYLKAEPEHIKKWERLFPHDKLNIGIFFRGNAGNKRTLHNRNVDFSLLKPILDIKGARCFSLQPENQYSKEFAGQNITDLSDKISNFSDTAAIIKCLDIVITIDSSVAHLAGALGKKTTLMLPWSADWRWFDDTKITPWYSSVEIFRQKTEGDWPPVINEIKNTLEKINRDFVLK